VAERFAEWRTAREQDKAKPWSNRHAGEVKRLGDKEIIPRLGKCPLIETTRGDWTALVAKKRKSAPAMASLLYRVCSSFLGHAEAHGWIALPLLPRKGLATLAPSAAPRERILTDDELRSIWNASAALNAKPRAFVQLLIMTAAREMEVADIAVGEIDRSTCTWTIPARRAKNKRAITLPLHNLALAALWHVWPEHGTAAGPQWKLLGDIAGSGLRGFSKLKTRLDEKSGIVDWRWHDLRRTARTAMTRLGVSRDHAEAAINHISGRSVLERTYDRHDFATEVIGALSQWQNHVAALASEATDAEVVSLRRRA
jgi:integrase